MLTRYTLVLICILNVALSIVAINHWVLSENGRIHQKVDSPYFMRDPSNLVTFLEQVKHNEIVESTYMELLRQRELTLEQINFSIKYGMEVIDQAKCALDFYKAVNEMTYTKITKKYLNRISIRKKTTRRKTHDTKPFCWQFARIRGGICCYEHLESLLDTMKLHFEPETDLKRPDLEFNNPSYVLGLVAGLEENPLSWKYHTLSSYYWRMTGDAHEAAQCALRAIMHAPRKFRDIPLLSLGTILFRANKLHDAEVLFSAAVDHAPEIPENHFALGTTLSMIYQFNRSVDHLEQTEKIDPSFIPRTEHLKNFISCVENLNKKTAKMYNYVDFIKNEVNGLKQMKNKIVSSHEKLIQHQVPLGARYFDTKTSNENLLNRGQYCSTRTISGNDEPVVFCDFYSDLQMRLESKEVDIESLERELKANSDAIIKKLSTDFQSQFAFDKVKGKKKES